MFAFYTELCLRIICGYKNSIAKNRINNQLNMFLQAKEKVWNREKGDYGAYIVRTSETYGKIVHHGAIIIS